MKFLGVLAESGAVDTLSKITEFTSKLCKEKVVVRFTPELIYLINPAPLASESSYLRVALNVKEFFSTYIMGGVSEELNEIYMELDKDHLYRSLSARDRSTKIRLTKLENKPHLRVEQRSCGIVHDLPVRLIKTGDWKMYDMPALNNIQVALYLPPVPTVRGIVTSFKNMGVKRLVIKGSQRGELQFCGNLDRANIDAHFSDLPNVSVDYGQENGMDNLDAFRTVRIDMKTIYVFLRSLVSGCFTMSRILLQIVPERMAILSVEQDEGSVVYVIGGIL